MKKVLALAVVAALSVASIGCGGSGASVTSVGTKAQTVSTTVKGK